MAIRPIRRSNLLTLLVAGKRAPDAQTVADQINARFATLQAAPIDVFMRGLRLFRTVDTFVRAVGLIAFWACVLFVSNTLVHALSERMREIGILMAIGWRRCRILWILLAEGALLSLCGALLGNGLAVVFLRLLGDNARLGFGWLPATIPLTHVALSMGLALAVAVVSSLWPAFVLLRFSPAQALRYE